MADLGEQVQAIFRDIYEAADRKYLRQIRRKMFLCGHDCLDDNNSFKQSEKCIDSCGRTMHKANGIMTDEINVFQGRIDRCFIDCQDSVRNEKDHSKAKALFDSCADSCVQKFVKIVPEVIKAMCDNLDKLKID